MQQVTRLSVEEEIQGERRGTMLNPVWVILSWTSLWELEMELSGKSWVADWSIRGVPRRECEECHVVEEAWVLRFPKGEGQSKTQKGLWWGLQQVLTFVGSESRVLRSSVFKRQLHRFQHEQMLWWAGGCRGGTQKSTGYSVIISLVRHSFHRFWFSFWNDHHFHTATEQITQKHIVQFPRPTAHYCDCPLTRLRAKCFHLMK